MEKMQHLPKVIFEINQEEDVRVIWHRLSGGSLSASWCYDSHPKLQKIMEGEGDRKKLTYEYLDGVYSTYKAPIGRAVGFFQSEWDKINDTVMIDLSKIIESEWSANHMRAQLTVTSVCARNLDNYWFQVYYRADAVEMKKIVIHELIHLLYFKKWHEVFPADDKGRFEAPDRIWALSEIVDAAIGNDERLRMHTGIVSENRYRKYFGETDFGGKKAFITDRFENMYKEMMAERNVPFAEFLKEARREMDQVIDKMSERKLAV